MVQCHAEVLACEPGVHASVAPEVCAAAIRVRRRKVRGWPVTRVRCLLCGLASELCGSTDQTGMSGGEIGSGDK